jgi:hypothetical protein
MGVSIWTDEIDPELGEPFHLKTLIAPYWRKPMIRIATTAPEWIEKLATNANHDWAGEPWFWLAVMALLNAKNGASAVYIPAPEALNARRRKAGKPEKVDYHQLTLRLGPHDAPRARGGVSDRGAMRAHTVRGHFKIRKSGVYWWRPFIRGEVAEGFARKSYKVKL